MSGYMGIFRVNDQVVVSNLNMGQVGERWGWVRGEVFWSWLGVGEGKGAQGTQRGWARSEEG